jgi:hypothetical protein
MIATLMARRRRSTLEGMMSHDNYQLQRRFVSSSSETEGQPTAKMVFYGLPIVRSSRTICGEDFHI